MSSTEPNALIHESSPYLLQHAYNPVQWEGWHDSTLEHARKSGKLLLISIGYAACHWCHVMERECFEDPEVADVMNAHFIPVKVDREERPDVDQIYMDALQIMSGSGGWPLNIVALPDGRPFWGATYVRKKDWINVLLQLAKLHREDPEKIRQYASDLTSALQRLNVMAESDTGRDQLPGRAEIRTWTDSWKKSFDPDFGGHLGAPKFMTPVLYQFLMHWGEDSGDPLVARHVRTTLKGMAYGGLYDQVGGGFSRYSVDPRWHIPHFEKMLYDNAQLISLYSEAYGRYRDPLYREVVAHTLEFLERELARPEGGYFASLDADSLDAAGELAEGAYYVWTAEELKEALQGDFDWFSDYYSVDDFGHWEEGNYVLIRRQADEDFAAKKGWSLTDLHVRITGARERLLRIRETRPGPRLDDKLITSWNGLLLSGLCDAFRYCGLKEALDRALDLAGFIENTLCREDGSLLHSHKTGGKPVNGYLEDYAAVIQGYLKLYSITRDPFWADRSRALTDYTLEHFSGGDQPLLYFTSSLDRALIRRTLEVNDSVMPSSNSVMAKNLFLLGGFFADNAYRDRAITMLSAMRPSMDRYAAQYPNWLQLALWLEGPFYEVVITGPDAEQTLETLQDHYLPNAWLAASAKPLDYPLFENRHDEGSTRIFICQHGQCSQPKSDPQEALEELTKGTRSQ